MQRETIMKSMVRTAMLAAAAAWPIAMSGAASAQVSPEFRNDKIVVFEREKGDRGYWTASGLIKVTDPDTGLSKEVVFKMKPEHEEIRAAMMKRRVLEEYAEFLSPLRMPRTLRL